MKKLLSIALSAIALAAFAADAKNKAGDPAENPFSNYSAAMSSTKENPSAVEWQAANDAAIAKAVSKEVLAKLAAKPSALPPGTTEA